MVWQLSFFAEANQEGPEPFKIRVNEIVSDMMSFQ
jgi:hypothetical protein